MGRTALGLVSTLVLAAGVGPPAAIAPPSPVRHSPIIPAILGTWQAGTVWAVNRDTHRMHVDRMPVNLELSDNALMPYGQRIEFTDGYDAKSRVAFLVMYLRPPFALNCLEYPTLRGNYMERNGVRHILQEPIKHEYDLTISKGEADDYEPVGALANEVTYFVQAGHEWNCEFYVSKDRQRMWKFMAIDVPTPGISHGYTTKRGFQLYCRLAEYKRHPIKP